MATEFLEDLVNRFRQRLTLPEIFGEPVAPLRVDECQGLIVRVAIGASVTRLLDHIRERLIVVQSAQKILDPSEALECTVGLLASRQQLQEVTQLLGADADFMRAIGEIHAGRTVDGLPKFGRLRDDLCLQRLVTAITPEAHESPRGTKRSNRVQRQVFDSLNQASPRFLLPGSQCLFQRRQ